MRTRLAYNVFGRCIQLEVVVDVLSRRARSRRDRDQGRVKGFLTMSARRRRARRGRRLRPGRPGRNASVVYGLA